MSSFLDRDLFPAFIRFVMEATTWVWLFFVNWIILVVDVILLALFNFPGDKEPKEEGVKGIVIPGKLRVTIEVLTALVGFWAAGVFGGLIPAGLQLVIVLAYFIADYERLRWMWGWQTYPPFYITKMHEAKKTMKEEQLKID